MDDDEGSLLVKLSAIEQDILQVDRAINKLQSKKKSLEAQRENLIKKQQQCISDKLSSLDWERTDHQWSKNVVEVLQNIFKLQQFRPYQLSTINAIMSKHDCILLMPTGGGKSLCYQLPALVLDGITLVISPLVSLMEDQTMSLESLNVPATMLNASSTREHVNTTQKSMLEKGSKLKLLFVTPEKLAKSKRFMAKLEKMYQMGRFSLLAIDEVHCCSQWGNDFRPDYKFLGIMKRQFPNVPILGLTATATSRVIADVQKILNIQNCLVLKASFNRPNLRYEVRTTSEKGSIAELEKLLKTKFNGLSGIIYCFSIKECEDIAAELRRRGIKAECYHAQLNAQVRSSVHRKWIANHVQVVVATVAFGMGIDKPDVRFVIHNSLAKSMENFYQESGRAGRDDQLAHCILFFRFSDIFRQSTMVFTEQTGLENLYSMVAYCLDLSRCRRAIIAQHFEERWDSADCKAMCDHCDRKTPYQVQEKDLTKECLSIYNILEYCSLKEERLTAQKLIDAWIGKGPPKLRPPDHKPTVLIREKCERIIAFFLLEGFLKEEFHFTPYSTISYINIGPKFHAVKSGSLIVEVPMPSIQPKVLPDVSSNASTPTKKLKTDNKSKVKTCFVNEEKSHFNTLSVAPVKKQLNGQLEKSLDKNENSVKYNSSDMRSSCEEISLSDEDLDFGEIKHRPKLIGKRKSQCLTVTISDSE